ncbi:hypothetical protein Mp_6g12260 [Marchantia polymorpha subsp. ruderalis]|uniref:Uncharacterized protein n=2 Tax=Marchantia polymorpha TaxID=3197 RepID=A0AAF6BR65_MARPO|nr:hypothetical protein MARPO_0135s0008 [Marchantia polymorpha]PTQ29724.1 hypothetical protein MARPO_0135s0010 [Marchantia polymorpha]BBN14499.1 hypothetical protein Mp_6g12260 [Marchantia polymorpha subsp. ruderalis]|eukprot:PTQ29722.1 hypothetical protein MARPO_0135s0008 [Marchantia polymorpha]
MPKATDEADRAGIWHFQNTKSMSNQGRERGMRIRDWVWDGGDKQASSIGELAHRFRRSVALNMITSAVIMAIIIRALLHDTRGLKTEAHGVQEPRTKAAIGVQSNGGPSRYCLGQRGRYGDRDRISGTGNAWRPISALQRIRRWWVLVTSDSCLPAIRRPRLWAFGVLLVETKPRSSKGLSGGEQGRREEEEEEPEEEQQQSNPSLGRRSKEQGGRRAAETVPCAPRRFRRPF